MYLHRGCLGLKLRGWEFIGDANLLLYKISISRIHEMIILENLLEKFLFIRNKLEKINETFLSLRKKSNSNES